MGFAGAGFAGDLTNGRRLRFNSSLSVSGGGTQSKPAVENRGLADLYFRSDLSVSQLGMPKERKIRPPDDAADPNKLPQNFRLTKETIRKLEKAALEYGMSKTVYVELALKDRFRKDAIT